MYPFGGGNVGKHRVFGDKVSDHDEAASAYVECSEQSLLHPVGEFLYALFVAAEFVIIKVIDDDIVRTGLTVAQASG